MNHHLILDIWRTMVVIVGAQSTTPWTCSEEHGVLAIIRWCSCPYFLQHVFRVLVTPSSAISDATVANPFVYKALRSPSGVCGLLIARTVRTRFAFLSFERGAHWLMDVNGVYKPTNITGGAHPVFPGLMARFQTSEQIHRLDQGPDHTMWGPQFGISKLVQQFPPWILVRYYLTARQINQLSYRTRGPHILQTALIYRRLSPKGSCRKPQDCPF